MDFLFATIKSIATTIILAFWASKYACSRENSSSTMSHKYFNIMAIKLLYYISDNILPGLTILSFERI